MSAKAAMLIHTLVAVVPFLASPAAAAFNENDVERAAPAAHDVDVRPRRHSKSGTVLQAETKCGKAKAGGSSAKMAKMAKGERGGGRGCEPTNSCQNSCTEGTVSEDDFDEALAEHFRHLAVCVCPGCTRPTAATCIMPISAAPLTRWPNLPTIVGEAIAPSSGPLEDSHDVDHVCDENAILGAKLSCMKLVSVPDELGVNGWFTISQAYPEAFKRWDAFNQVSPASSLAFCRRVQCVLCALRSFFGGGASV